MATYLPPPQKGYAPGGVQIPGAGAAPVPPKPVPPAAAPTAPIAPEKGLPQPGAPLPSRQQGNPLGDVPTTGAGLPGRAPLPTPQVGPGITPITTANVPGYSPTAATPPQPGPGITPIPAGIGNPSGTLPNPYLTPFGPGNDLVGTQINPMATPRLQGTMGAVDAATQALAGAPDRQQLAGDYFQSLLAQAQPQFEQNLRSITQRNAATGRLGSGMYGSDLVDAATGYQRNLTNAAADLAYNTGSQAFSDRLSGLGALSGLEAQQFGQGAAQRDELRGERGYQYGLGQNAIDRNVQQQQLQDYLLNSAFGRDQQRIDTLAGLGFGGGTPAGTYLGASGMAQGQANASNDALYQLLAQYAMGG